MITMPENTITVHLSLIEEKSMILSKKNQTFDMLNKKAAVTWYTRKNVGIIMVHL